MTFRRTLGRHLPPRVKQLIKTVVLRERSTLGWPITKADLRPEDTVALVANAGELARRLSDIRRLVKAARARSCKVQLYLLDFDLTAPIPTFADVAVLRFWIDAAPSPRGRISNSETAIPSDLAEAPYPLRDGSWATGYYSNGRPMIVVTHHKGGTSVEHLDPSGQSVRRDEFDQDGQLVRHIDLHPGSGKAVVRRYVDSSGTTWLRTRVGVDQTDSVRQFRPEIKNYDALADIQVAWFRKHLRQSDRIRILACGKASHRIVERVQT